MIIKKINKGVAPAKVNQDDPKAVIIKDLRSVVFSTFLNSKERYLFDCLSIEWNHGLDLKLDGKDVLACIYPNTLKMAAKDLLKTAITEFEVSVFMDKVLNDRIRQKLDDAGYEVEVYSMPVYRKSYGNSFYVTLGKKE